MYCSDLQFALKNRIRIGTSENSSESKCHTMKNNSHKVYWPIDFYCINTAHTLAASINKFHQIFQVTRSTHNYLFRKRVMIMFVSIVYFYCILDCNPNCELIELKLIPLSFPPFQIIFKFIEINVLTVSSNTLYWTDENITEKFIRARRRLICV